MYASSRPSWPHCGHGADPATDPVGCCGIHVPGHTACLAHLTETDRTAYLSTLSPGATIDHRATTFTQALLAALLHALADPTTGEPHLGGARFDEAQFFGDAEFSKARFSGPARFDEVQFCGNAGFVGVQFSSTTAFVGAQFSSITGFAEAHFAGDAEFGGAQFSSTTGFAGAQFSSVAGFAGAQFSGIAGFGGAQFSDEARFDAAVFRSRAHFAGAQFSSVAAFREARFTRAEFGWTQFSSVADFGGAQFSDEARFDTAVFRSKAHFAGAQFSSVAAFREARFTRAEFGEARFTRVADFGRAQFSSIAEFVEAQFSSIAEFVEAQFSNEAGFDRAVFRGDAQFARAQFSGPAWFQEAQFAGPADFGDVQFSGAARFEGAQFADPAWFGGARFVGVSLLGPLVCAGQVVLSGAVFVLPVTLEIVARKVVCERTRWESTATVRVRYAAVDLSHAVLSAPAAVLTHPTPFNHSGTTVGENLPASPGAQRSISERVRIASVQGVDAAHLVLTDTDLTGCLFSGAFHLDQIRLEGRTTFAGTPTGWHSRDMRLVRFTRRRVLAEEHHWRAHTAGPGHHEWRRGPHHPDPARTPDPEDVAALYRQLRKAFEDGKNEPGAADFYYGECEMRRHDITGTSKGERRLLWGYWLLSGYGLRAARAFGWLFAAMSVTVLLLMGVGLPTHDPDPTTTGTLNGSKISLNTSTPDPALQGGWQQRMTWARVEKATRVVVNSVVFRSSGENLTTAGTFIEMASRLLEPTLLAFGALAVRGRIKR